MLKTFHSGEISMKKLVLSWQRGLALHCSSSVRSSYLNIQFVSTITRYTVSFTADNTSDKFLIFIFFHIFLRIEHPVYLHLVTRPRARPTCFYKLRFGSGLFVGFRQASQLTTFLWLCGDVGRYKSQVLQLHGREV